MHCTRHEGWGALDTRITCQFSIAVQKITPRLGGCSPQTFTSEFLWVGNQGLAQLDASLRSSPGNSWGCSLTWLKAPPLREPEDSRLSSSFRIHCLGPALGGRRKGFLSRQNVLGASAGTRTQEQWMLLSVKKQTCVGVHRSSVTQTGKNPNVCQESNG